MASEVHVGDYIIDAAVGAANDSTTDGARLFWPGDTGPVITELPEAAEFSFIVQITADDTEGLIAAIEEVREALTAPTGVVTIKHDGGDDYAVFDAQGGVYSRMEADITENVGTTAAALEVTLRAVRDEGLRPNPDLPDGALDVFNWEYEAGPDGFAAAIGTFTFEDRTSAGVYLASIRSGTRPAWLPSSFVFSNFAWGADEPATGEYKPARLIVAFEQFPAYATGGPWANVKAFEVAQNIAPLRVDARAGNNPQYSVTINGSITLKVAANASFDSSDTTVAAEAEMRQQADPVIDALLRQAAIRFGSDEYTEVERLYPSFDVKRGVVAFAAEAVTGGDGTVVSWDETITAVSADRDLKVWDSDGEVTVLEHAAGYELRVRQSCTVLSVGNSRPIPVPSMSPSLPSGYGASNSNWKLEVWEPDHRVELNVADPGRPIHRRALRAEWLYLKRNLNNAQLAGTSAGAWG